MSTLSAALRSSIGAKLVMAITGAGLLLFVVVHLLGNLQVFLGQDALNHYGEKLREYPGLLWAARLGLLVFAVLHIVASLRVSWLNRAARPERYALHTMRETGFAARTMLLSGVLAAGYVVYHLLHFTFRSVHTRYAHLQDAQGRPDIYSMLVGSFQEPLISGAYIVAMVLLSMHLSHGIGGFLQSLGIGHPRYGRGLRLLGPVAATLIAAGYISIPAAVLLGLVRLPPGGR
jgi:succinate dehydrogenase / fumarate reductase cytochrome b subunit